MGRPGRCRSFQVSNKLEFELFRDACVHLGECTCADTECALDDARLPADVLRDV